MDKAIILEQKFFGRQISNSEYADLVGAPANSEIAVSASEEEAQIILDAKNGKYSLVQSVSIQYVDRRLTLFINQFGMAEEQPRGIGTRMLARMVETAREMGIEEIFLHAVGNAEDSVYNGYYTWPRLGFNGDLADIVGMPEKLESAGYIGVETTRELFRRKDGLAWWKQNGDSIFCFFDLSPESESSNDLRVYLQQEGIVAT